MRSNIEFAVKDISLLLTEGGSVLYCGKEIGNDISLFEAFSTFVDFCVKKSDESFARETPEAVFRLEAGFTKGSLSFSVSPEKVPLIELDEKGLYVSGGRTEEGESILSALKGFVFSAGTKVLEYRKEHRVFVGEESGKYKILEQTAVLIFRKE